jgi:hypothetical protein
VAYPQAVATDLDRRDIRLFDYAKQLAVPFRRSAWRPARKIDRIPLP